MFDFGASAFNIGLQAFHDQKARDWQVSQTDQEYRRHIKERDYMNWYNSPKETMGRFEEAGLNPNLIYGSGTTGTQRSPAGVPKAPSGRWSKFAMTPFDVQGAVRTVMDVLKKRKDIQNIDSNISLNEKKGAGIALDNAIKNINKEIMESKTENGNMYAQELADMKLALITNQGLNALAQSQVGKWTHKWKKLKYETFTDPDAPGVNIDLDKPTIRILQNIINAVGENAKENIYKPADKAAEKSNSFWKEDLGLPTWEDNPFIRK